MNKSKLEKLKKQVAAEENKVIKKVGIKDLLELSIVKTLKKVCDIDLTERILNVTAQQLEDAEKLSKAYMSNNNVARQYNYLSGYNNLICSIMTREELDKVIETLDNEEEEREELGLPMPKGYTRHLRRD